MSLLDNANSVVPVANVNVVIVPTFPLICIFAPFDVTVGIFNVAPLFTVIFVDPSIVKLVHFNVPVAIVTVFPEKSHFALVNVDPVNVNVVVPAIVNVLTSIVALFNTTPLPVDCNVVTFSLDVVTLFNFEFSLIFIVPHVNVPLVTETVFPSKLHVVAVIVVTVNAMEAAVGVNVVTVAVPPVIVNVVPLAVNVPIVTVPLFVIVNDPAASNFISVEHFNVPPLVVIVLPAKLQFLLSNVELVIVNVAELPLIVKVVTDNDEDERKEAVVDAIVSVVIINSSLVVAEIRDPLFMKNVSQVIFDPVTVNIFELAIEHDSPVIAVSDNVIVAVSVISKLTQLSVPELIEQEESIVHVDVTESDDPIVNDPAFPNKREEISNVPVGIEIVFPVKSAVMIENVPLVIDNSN